MAGELRFNEEEWARFEKHVVSINTFADEMALAISHLSKDAARSRLKDSRKIGRFTARTIKEVSQTLTITPDELEAIVRGSLITDPPVSPEALYLKKVIEDHAVLRLQAVNKDAVKPGSEPLQLRQVYVDLNLDVIIPRSQSLAALLQSRKGSVRESDIFQADLLIPFRELEASGSIQITTGKGSRKTPSKIEDILIPVPALEAVGLHQRLVLLGPPGSGKSTITAMMALTLAEALLRPKAQRADVLKPLGKWWTAGALLPVRVILRQFGASLPAGLERGRAKHLWDFIETELQEGGLNEEAANVPRNAVATCGVMFLLDGLDEVRDETTRARMLEAVAEFAKTAGEKCRFLITARPYAWEAFKDESISRRGGTPAELVEMHASYTLADLETEQIEEFIYKWYRAIQAAGWPVADVKNKPAQLIEAAKRLDLRDLAKNPLLLTLMATLHSNQKQLPEDRADLYHEVVELLLKRWADESDGLRGLLVELNIPGLRMDHIRQKLEGLAYRVHGATAGESGAADIAEGELFEALKPLLNDSHDQVKKVLSYVEHRAGLLLDQGERKGEQTYTFPHRTFQEYLAARYLAAGRVDFVREATRCARENPAHWREVLVLAARCAGAGRGVPVADALVHRRSAREYQEEAPIVDSDWRSAIIAAEQLLEIGKADVESESNDAAVLRRVAGWLASLLEAGALPTKERAKAGDLLARLGDPRPGVGLKDGLPDIDWIKIPAGEFLYGTRKKQARIDKAYRVGRYPVTVAQFAAFVEAGGYTDAGRKFWSDSGWDWRESEKRSEPDDYTGDFQLENRPRVGVTWFEADAFCRWLSSVRNERIRLPLEQEWERAARHTDGREFPWGDSEDSIPERCNSFSELGTTSSVGLYPGGKSVCGADDMAGNVWEWCEDFGDSDKDSRVLRGGSWIDDFPDFFRCALRLHDHPVGRDNGLGFRCVCES